MKRFLICLFLATSSSGAQEQPPRDSRESPADAAAEILPLEEVVTTATKKGEAEIAQSVPAAISVLGSDSLAAGNVTDFEDLSYALPNVALDAIGTGKGIANFSMREPSLAGASWPCA